MKFAALALLLSLAACSARFPTSDREAKNTFNEGTYGKDARSSEGNLPPSQELENLRAERTEIDLRIAGTRMRDDNPGHRTSPFPDAGAVDMSAMRERKSQVEARIADLEAAAREVDEERKDTKGEPTKP